MTVVNYSLCVRTHARTPFSVLKFAKTIVNDDHQDATFLACLFIPNQLHMFREMSSPIVTSTGLYLQL